MDRQVPMFEEAGLKMPKRVQKRFCSTELAKVYGRQSRENNKTRTLYCYSTVASHMWEFLRNEMDLHAMCAPVVIDRHTGTDVPVLFKNGEATAWMIGAFNTSAFNTRHTADKDVSIYVPLDYEIRIFHENMMREIRSMFGKHPIEHEILLTMSHALTHEMCHYIMLLAIYDRTFGYNASKYDELTNYLIASGTREMEYTTEELALQMLTRYWLTNTYNLRDLGDPVLGGPYDQWMCHRDDEWAITSLYLRTRRLINLETIGKGSKENDDLYYEYLDAIDIVTDRHRGEARPFALLN